MTSLGNFEMPIKNAIHPADVIKSLFKETGTKLYGCPGFNTIYRFIYSHSRITENIAKKLSGVFPDTDVAFWLNLQRDYEVSKLDEKDK